MTCRRSAAGSGEPRRLSEYAGLPRKAIICKAAVGARASTEAAMISVEKPGQSAPLGASVQADGVNFSLFSRSATGVELLLFDGDDDPRPARVVRLDPAKNR